MRWTTAALLLWIAARRGAAARQRRRQVPGTSQLVVEVVTVKDKSGKTVEGLTAKDFTVTENGVPQQIKFFEYQKLPDAPCRRCRWRPRRPSSSPKCSR